VSPSIVAARIVQCLTRRSLIAQYDDNESSAMVFEGGMASFGIQLYRGDKKGPAPEIPLLVDDNDTMSMSVKNTTQKVVRPDSSHGIIVECARIRGDVIAFHKDCQAVLAGVRNESYDVDECRRPLGVLLMPSFGFSDMRVGDS